jgi:hypothetical protein
VAEHIQSFPEDASFPLIAFPIRHFLRPTFFHLPLLYVHVARRLL